MRAHRNDVYRARRSRGKAWPVILWILAGLIVLAVILFYAGQKYIVYDSDGSLHVVFPIMETPAPVTEGGQPETVDTEVVLEDPDYSGIVSDAGKGLTELHAQYLTADKITPDGLTRAASAVKAAGGNALVLQMKAPGGTLSWKSGVSDAAAYGVNGTAELADAIRTVKGQNIYLFAVVSTCVDTLMAERYAATALQTASGSAYTDGSGGWVDPYNTFIRTYLVSLCKELHDLGFDEVAFSRVVHLLAHAPRIGAAGCGHSGIICQHFAHLMCCIERPARFISPAEAVHGATGFLQQGDVMVFASRGGKTKELLPIVDICKAKGVSIITVTENLESPLAQAADVVLKQHVNRETDKWNAQGTTSTTALCMIFHALQAALIEETGYQAEQFALIHPGGAVGERLNHKAL